ncbi:TPA: hypothetical protein ACKLO9_001548 [Neisseria gonorrhoeae]
MTTRKTYDLPEPTIARDTFSTWFTSHSIEIEGDIDNDGGVLHNRSRKTINIDTHEGEELALDYDEARRVALALLAAVEEAETMREGNQCPATMTTSDRAADVIRAHGTDPAKNRNASHKT